MAGTQKKLIDEQWQRFDRDVIPEDAPPGQRIEMRRAFYAGAVSLFSSIVGGLGETEETTPVDLAMMEGIRLELLEWSESARRGEV